MSKNPVPKEFVIEAKVAEIPTPIPQTSWKKDER
jgi:hypothetical protein